eukprot:m.330728 g.330728  ORF g.330728 m.330728 type:complete len:447 (-) comp19766_c1_seq9:662-2002(-)
MASFTDTDASKASARVARTSRFPNFPSRSRTRSTLTDTAEEGVARIEQFVASKPWELDDLPAGSVLFCIKSSVSYAGSRDNDCPVHNGGLDIRAGDVVQIFQVLDEEWWLGKVVGGGSRAGLVPTPRHFLEKHRAEMSNIAGPSRSRLRAFSTSQNQNRARARTAALFAAGAAALDGGDGVTQQDDAPSDTANVGRVLTSVNLFNPAAPTQYLPGCVTDVRHKQKTPYKLAPKIRPIVLVGPSKHGHVVTDKMQRCLVGYLRTAFGAQCVYIRLESHANSSVKQPQTSASPSVDSFDSNTPAPLLTASNHIWDPEDLFEIDDISNSGRLPIVQVDVETPSVLREAPFMPLLIFVKISHIAVLTKLIKARGGGHHMSTQINMAEQLNAVPDKDFDLVLSHSKVDKSCRELAAFVDAYLAAVLEPPSYDPHLLSPWQGQENSAESSES